MAHKPNYIPDFWVPTQRLVQGDPAGRSFQDLANRRWTMAGMDYPSPMPIPGTTSGGYSVPGVDGDVVWNTLAVPEDVYPAFQIYDEGRTYTYNWSYYGRNDSIVTLVGGTTSGHYGVIVNNFHLEDMFCAQTYDELTEMGAWNWDTETTLNETVSYGPLFGFNPFTVTRHHWSCIFVYGPGGTIIAWAGMTWTSFWPLDVFDTVIDDLNTVILQTGLEHADERLQTYLSQGGFSGAIGYVTNTNREFDNTFGTTEKVHEGLFTQLLTMYEFDGLVDAVHSVTYWTAGGDTSSVPIMNIEDIPAENFRDTLFALDYIIEPGTVDTVLMVDTPYHTSGGSNGRQISGVLNEYLGSVVAANDYPGDSPEPDESYERVGLYVTMDGYEMYTYYASPIQLPTETHLTYTAHIGSQSWRLNWPENMLLWNSNILIYDHGKYITFSWLIHTDDFAGYGYQGACLFVRHVASDGSKTYSMVMRYHDVVNESATFKVKEKDSMATYTYWPYYQPDLKMVSNPVRPA